MMFSIKPLEWSGRSSNGKIHKAYVVPMEYWAWESAGFGYWSWGSLAGREVYGGLDGAKAAAQADYESRIFSAISTPPAAAESNASAEARLREALATVDDLIRRDPACFNLSGYGSIEAAIDAANANARTCKHFAAALERIRDGEPNAPQIALDALRMPWEVSGLPSDPTADRREIVARLAYGLSNNPDLWDHPHSVLMRDRAYEVADAILAALDGGR